VELVEALLAVEQAQRALPELAVSEVEEHALGWLVYWQSADYLRSREFAKMLVGQGPYLVDREDGSIHHIPVTTFVSEDWEQLYREQARGLKPPDPLLSAVRALVQHDGIVPALRHLRQQAPRLSLQEAKMYVDALRNGDEPAEELTRRTRPEPERTVFAIERLTGLVDDSAGDAVTRK
jgi:hypothetical protein